MPTSDPDPAGLGTYLICATILVVGLATFLRLLIGDLRADRGQDGGGSEAATEAGTETEHSAAVPQQAQRDLLCARWKRTVVGASRTGVDDNRSPNSVSPR